MDQLISDSFIVQSKILGEDRKIYVYLPPFSKESKEVYSVIYLLDGHSLHNVVSSFVQYYSSRGRIPPLIVVGIASIDRLRDFTPNVRLGSDGDKPLGGGADKFLGFLSEELIPVVEDKYPVGGYRILIGHSLGGLFTVYTMVDKPDLFRAYIVCSPWLGSEDEQLILKAKTGLKEDHFSSKMLFIAHEPIGGGGIEGRIMKLVEVFRENLSENLIWGYKRYDDADHSNLPLKAIPDALDFFFHKRNSET